VEQNVVNDLIDQYQRAFKMLYEEIARFNPAQWNSAFALFQHPVLQALHIVDCLDFYSSADINGTEYTWGHRFGGGWWETRESQWPDQSAVLVYAHEIETRIVTDLAKLSDADLLKPFTNGDSAKTVLGHHIYALRHTMHHHGELVALAVYHTGDGGSWY
jgi:hypothetical protein